MTRDRALDAPQRAPAAADAQPPGASAIERALAAVLAEIDEIAVATFRSIGLAKTLKRVAREPGA